MAFISVLQGAASQADYRALVLGRGLRAPLAARLTRGTGLVSLTPAKTTPKLKKQLSARRITAYSLRMSRLAPGTDYRVRLSDGTTETSLDTYTLPKGVPTEGITFAVGGCFYEGFHFGERLRTALQRTHLVTRPAFQIWTGDNLYVDVPRFSGKNSPHGHVLERYLQYFEGKPYSFARASMPNFTTYDDHEFWNNYPESQIWIPQSWGGNHDEAATAALDCLDLFQSSINPPPVADGRSFEFSLPPLSFFFADVRSKRTQHGIASPRMMTKDDLGALLKWAKNLQGPGVLVVGQPWWTGTGGFTDYNPPDFRDEYAKVWAALRDAPWDVLILTGDVHHSRVLAFDLVGSPASKVYEITTSPASHIPDIPSSAGFGHAQDRGSMSAPGRIENAGIKVGAREYFGTTAPNTFALLRFAKKPGGEVSVGTAFVDYGGARPRFAPSERCPRLPDSGRPFAACFSTDLFTLRKR